MYPEVLFYRLLCFSIYFEVSKTEFCSVLIRMCNGTYLSSTYTENGYVLPADIWLWVFVVKTEQKCVMCFIAKNDLVKLLMIRG